MLALLFALLAPAPGVFIKEYNLTSVLIIIIFFINGLNIKLSNIVISKKLIVVLFLSILISLVIGPLLAISITNIFTFQVPIVTGLLIISSMPSTISSGIVMTELSGGDVTIALLLTIILNLSAVFILPIIIPIIFKGTLVEVSGLILIKKLTLVVFLPFIVGYFVKGYFSKALKYLTHIPSICVILIVYGSLSKSRTNLLELSLTSLPIIILVVLTIHILLFMISLFLGKLIRLQSDVIKPFTLVSSQKTLPLALTIISTMKGIVGVEIIVCILFHFTQLFVDSFIASNWKNKILEL